LRNASERRVRLLEEITAAAASALAEAGHSASGGVLDRIGRTLLAAGGDDRPAGRGPPGRGEAGTAGVGGGSASAGCRRGRRQGSRTGGPRGATGVGRGETRRRLGHRRHKVGVNSTSTGKSSKRPTIISPDNSHLPRSGSSPKFDVGPTAPSPG